MKFSNLLKKLTPLFLGFIVLVGVMNFNSHDTKNSLPYFGPSLAMAQVGLPPAVLRTCNIDANVQQVVAGESVTISWRTEGFSQVTINGQVVSPISAGTITFNNIQQNTTYTLIAQTQDGSSNCVVSVTVACIPIPVLPTCVITPATRTINSGESVNLDWSTTNAASVNISGLGAVSLVGNRLVGPISTTTTYVLTASGAGGQSVTCTSVISVVSTPPPSMLPVCNSFTALPTSITRGGTSNLAWSTTNATRVVIDNAIGQVANTGNLTVSPLSTTIYTMTVFGAGGQSVSCNTTVTVANVPPPAITCANNVSFIAIPARINQGGNSTLTWTTAGITAVRFDQGISRTELAGSLVVTPQNTTTYTLTATAGTSTIACPVTVTVDTVIPPSTLSCANNVSFNTNPARITQGGNSTLTWSTVGITAVRFDQGISRTELAGSLVVTPQNTSTYTLTATAGTSTIACPVTVTVETSGGGGGGGGGSSSPRCELSISKNKINRGDSATLSWDTTRATDIEIVDAKNRVIVTTTGLSSKDKNELYDGTVKVLPTADTKYTLTAKRGSKEKVCTASIDVENPIVITQIRDQQPLIAGIALSQVPYTGFEAGPFLTLSFYVLLLAWALYIAYVLVIRRDVLGGYALAKTHIVAEELTPEQIRPDVFVKSVSTIPRPAVNVVPAGLPVAEKVIGYDALVGAANIQEAVTAKSSVTSASDEAVTALENYAHAKKALLSSDAIRYFTGTTQSEEERFSALNDVITTAKEKYPAEDGWVVINEKRMRDLCVTCNVSQLHSSVAPYVPTIIPEGSGSLAEAIVAGNIVGAYEMIGHRPMFALADAASDLDSVYRIRKGEKMIISDMLQESTASLSDEQIMQMIKALTGALDGTYNDEESAVKMAIMKAVKVVA